MEDEELIRQRMERTRESLTEKLETLEDKLVGSVEEATSAVREAVAGVKETMHEGVESVKDAVDIPAHVERRPWLMLGGAILGGYALGSLLLRQSERSVPQSPPLAQPPRRPVYGNGHAKQAPPPPSPPRTESVAESSSESIFHVIEPEVRQLKGLALGVTLGTVREMLTKEAPEHLADQLRDIVDSITRKVGGEPIAAADLPFSEPAACQTQESHSPGSPFEAEKPRW
jgi:hypothetical protein